MESQRGFTYLGMLLAIALLGVGLTAASEVWVTTARKQRMEQLDWAGQQFVQAIGSYYEASPTAVKVYPAALGDLIEDKRFPMMRRHLRQVYPNPLSGSGDWELLLMPDGRIRGVRATGGARAAVAKEYVYVPGR